MPLQISIAANKIKARVRCHFLYTPAGTLAVPLVVLLISVGGHCYRNSLSPGVCAITTWDRFRTSSGGDDGYPPVYRGDYYPNDDDGINDIIGELFRPTTAPTVPVPVEIPTIGRDEAQQPVAMPAMKPVAMPTIGGDIAIVEAARLTRCSGILWTLLDDYDGADAEDYERPGDCARIIPKLLTLLPVSDSSSAIRSVYDGVRPYRGTAQRVEVGPFEHAARLLAKMKELVEDFMDRYEKTAERILLFATFNLFLFIVFIVPTNRNGPARHQNGRDRPARQQRRNGPVEEAGARRRPRNPQDADDRDTAEEVVLNELHVAIVRMERQLTERLRAHGEARPREARLREGGGLGAHRQ